MEFKRIIPSPALRPYVRSFWLLTFPEGSDENQFPSFVPDGYPELIFSLNGDSNAGLIGQLEKCQEVNLPFLASGALLLVKLYPFVPFLLFGIPMDLLKNNIYDINDLDNAFQFKTLRQQVNAAKNLDDGVRILEHALFMKIAQSKSRKPVLEYAMEQIINSSGNIDLQTLRTKLNISQRHLELLFRKHIGMSPKHYCKLIKVKKLTVNILSAKKDIRFSDMAYQYGYFDQSHFIKDFKSITNTSPRTFLMNKELFLPSEGQQDYLAQWGF